MHHRHHLLRGKEAIHQHPEHKRRENGGDRPGGERIANQQRHVVRVITRPSVTDQLPQIKNCINIINDRRGTSRCCTIAFSLLSVVVTMMSLTLKK
jgi:hypothetical protein